MVERQEVGIALRQLGCHKHIGVVNAEVCKDTLVKLERKLSGITVIHPLSFCVVNVLTCVLVLELQSEHRNTVDNQNHIHGFVVVCGVMPLAYHVANVLLVKHRCRLVQMGFGLEVAYTEGNTSVLKTVSEHRDQTVGITSIVERYAEFLDRIALAGILKTSPFLGLRSFDKADQRVNVKSDSRIVCIGGLGVTALFG